MGNAQAAAIGGKLKKYPMIEFHRSDYLVQSRFDLVIDFFRQNIDKACRKHRDQTLEPKAIVQLTTRPTKASEVTEQNQYENGCNDGEKNEADYQVSVLFPQGAFTQADSGVVRH